MNWKVKAIIQNLVDKLPSALSYPIYYYLQRSFGGLKTINPINALESTIKIVDIVRKNNQTIKDKIFLEIGTGRTIDVPIGLWLCGAKKIITIDLNEYLREELVIESITWIKEHQQELKKLFGNFVDDQEFNNRMRILLSLRLDLASLLKELNIEYMAPADAAHLPFLNGIIDYHFSINVFEHIPINVLESILLEAKRLLSNEGFLIHLIDLSDHFAHFDKSITSINFMKFSEKEWKKWAGNRFMYHNRLRTYQIYTLLNKVGIDIIWKEEQLDERALVAINQGFPLNEQYVGHFPTQLATTRLNIMGKFN